MRESRAIGPSARRLWSWAIFISVAGVGARALWYLKFRDDLDVRLGPDALIFLAQAESFVRDGITSASHATLDATPAATPPGYPLLITGIWNLLPAGDVYAGREYVLLIVRGVQWLLAGATTLMTFALARRVLFGFSALVPPLLLTISIAMIDTPNLFMNETLLAFLLTAAVLSLVQAREAAAQPSPDPPAQGAKPKRRLGAGLPVMIAGLAVSCAVLTQPRIAVTLPFVAIWLLTAAPRRYCAIFVLVSLLLPAAWVVRDYAIYDEIVPVSVGWQVALYEDNVRPVGGSGTRPLISPECVDLDPAGVGGPANAFEFADCMQRQGLGELTAHPGRSARAIPDRLAALVSPWNPDHARGEYRADMRHWRSLIPVATRADSSFVAADRVVNVVWIALYVLFLALGLWSLWPEGPGSPARLIAIPILTLPLAHLLFHAEGRFRLPMLPLLAIALTLGILAALEILRGDRVGEPLTEPLAEPLEDPPAGLLPEQLEFDDAAEPTSYG
ncbi:MAG: hypothetical protein WAP37_06190 [Solirubrobacterales bacterium]